MDYHLAICNTGREMGCAMLRELPDDETGNVLRSMSAGGDDLSVPRDINFSVVFPDETSACNFAVSIQPRFNTVFHSEMETSHSLKWDVTATTYMVPNHRGITEIEKFLAAAAGPFGGENDGWGCFRITG